MPPCMLNLPIPHRKLERSRLSVHGSPLRSARARQATWLFVRRPEELTTQEKELVQRLRQLHAEVDLAYLLVQQCVQMVRTRTGERLDAWLAAVASSPLTDLQSFADRVSEEKEAVFAGLTRNESNGPDSGTHYASQTDQTQHV
jgi:transposase